MWNRRNQEAAQRFAERRQREDEAPRLAALIPELEDLRLDVREGGARAESTNAEGSHIRRIVVASAPALFLITCHDTNCRDGGHDLTYPVMQALRARKTNFSGESACQGQTGSANCQRVLRFVGTAAYRDPARK